MNGTNATPLRHGPRTLCDSVLLSLGGCAVYDQFPGRAACKRLLKEANLCLRHAVVTAVATSDGEEGRGGNPARRFISAGGGDLQTGLYHDPDTARFLSAICNSSVRPTGRRGTYTYYCRPGDHLALHRDIEACDLAVVTCLLDRHRPGSLGGITRFYPRRWHEPLSRIRATPAEGAVSIRLPVGHTMVMLGGVVPHLIVPVGQGECRVVSILCFRVSAD